MGLQWDTLLYMYIARTYKLGCRTGSAISVTSFPYPSLPPNLYIYIICSLFVSPFPHLLLLVYMLRVRVVCIYFASSHTWHTHSQSRESGGGKGRHTHVLAAAAAAMRCWAKRVRCHPHNTYNVGRPHAGLCVFFFMLYVAAAAAAIH